MSTVAVHIDLPAPSFINPHSVARAIVNAQQAAMSRGQTPEAHALAMLLAMIPIVQPQTGVLNQFIPPHFPPGYATHMPFSFSCHRCHGATTVQLVGPGAKPSPCPDCGGTGKSVKS